MYYGWTENLGFLFVPTVREAESLHRPGAHTPARWKTLQAYAPPAQRART